MERHIHRRAVALEPHMRGGSAGLLLPGDLRFARREGGADVVGDLVRKRRVRVDRPAAEVERVDIPSQAREAGFWKRNFPPSEPAQCIELGRLKRDRRQTGYQGLIEPDL